MTQSPGQHPGAAAEGPVTATSTHVPGSATPAAAEQKELPVIAPVYTLEVKQAEIPESKANGIISGTNFVADAVRLDKTANGYVLTLWQGAGPGPGDGVQVFLRLKPNEAPTNMNLTVPSDTKPAVATPVTKNWGTRPGSPSQSRSYSMGYALRLELGNPKGNSIPGKLYLALPDTERTVIAGVFEATLPAYGLTAMQNSEDWPQWRGPLRNGLALVSPPLANSWLGEGPKLLWKAERLMNGGKATGHSSPVVVGGQVYLHGNWSGANTPGGANDAVACLSASTGSLLWRSVFPVNDEDDPTGASHSSTPCVGDGRLYVAGHKQAYCLDAKDGKLLWQQPLDARANGMSSSFAVMDGVAILTCKGFYGFEALTGQVRWHRSEDPGPGAGVFPSPACWRHEGKNYVVCPCRSVELMEPTVGEAIWKIPWLVGSWTSPTGNWRGNSTPAIVGDWMVLTQTGDVTAMEAYKMSLEGPKKLWHVAHHDSATSPLIYQGYVYTIGGGDYGKATSIRCVELQTGRVAWEQRTFPQGCSSPIAADGKIFGYLKFGKLLCMWKADPNRCTLLASTPVRSDGYSSLAFAQGHLFVRLDDGVACYDVTARGQ